MDKIKALREKISEQTAGLIKKLEEINEITIPQTAFGRGDELRPLTVYYISDVHLEAHMDAAHIDMSSEKAIKRYIKSLIEALFNDHILYAMTRSGVSPDNMADLLHGYYYLFVDETREMTEKDRKELARKLSNNEVNMPVAPRLQKCIVIDGDLTDDIDTAELFFSCMMKHIRYCKYKDWKRRNYDITRKKHIENKEIVIKLLNEKVTTMEKERDEYRERIREIEKKTGKRIYAPYHGIIPSEYRRLIMARKEIPNKVISWLDKIRELNKKIDFLKVRPESYYQGYCISVADFDIQDIKCCPIYYVLGNHEYSQFRDVPEANTVFKSRLEKYGVTILDKEIVDFGNCVVFGGTGFAKHNERYNADNLVGPKDMIKNREYEIEESDFTQVEYEKALEKAKMGNKPLLSITHYPLKDWMSSMTDEYAYYFTGHDHKNYISAENNSHVFADNQIGYYSNAIEFKSVQLGTSYNPFIEYEDGIHEITPKQYSDYYKYTGEYVGIGLIQRQVNKQAKLYLIKQNGFYGFFIVNDKNTKICVGGRTKVISEIIDIRYFYECFCTMIYQYVAALLPLRKYQEQLSKMIRELKVPYPWAGRIHGCIVDVDFYHHIMINPYDGKTTFYYSPYFGMVKKFDAFEALLESMEAHDYMLKSNMDYLSAKENAVSTGILRNELAIDSSGSYEFLDIKNSLYSVSNRVNQLQRLFTSNILRDWDDAIIKDILGKTVVEEMLPEKKPLSDYNLVQKSWINLLNIPSERITPRLVECALDRNRKCFFPYTSLKSRYIDFRSHMSNTDLQEYINHIPQNILKLYIRDFADRLGLVFFEVYPLNILNEDDYEYVFSSFGASNKELLEMANRLPEEKWNESFGKWFAKEITVKNRPNYCSKELWDKIMTYRI